MKNGKTGLARLVAATEYSRRGFVDAFRHEEAFRQELALVVVGLLLAIPLSDSAVEFLLLAIPLLLILLAELLNSAIGFMQSAEAFVSSQELRETPLEVRALLGDLRGILTSEDVQNIPVSLNAAIARVETILAQIEDGRAVDM